MNFADVTNKLAQTLKINPPVGMTERQSAAAVMMIAVKVIEHQRDEIAKSTALDMRPVPSDRN